MIQPNPGVQKQLRQNFEMVYKQRLLTMKNFYQMRYQTLEQVLASSYKRVLQDEILSTMVGDITTSTYVQERVSQLFKQIVDNEREVLIEKLGLKYSELKFNYEELEKKFQGYRKEVEASQEKLTHQRRASETEKTEYADLLRKKDYEMGELKLQLKEKTIVLGEKDKSNRELEAQIAVLKEENMKIKMEFEAMQEQISEAFGDQKNKIKLRDIDLQESQKKLNMLQNTLKQMEKANQDKSTLLEAKYRKKIGEYKAKIEQYKSKIMQVLSSRQQDTPNPQYQMRIQQLEKKLSLVSRESEKKISDLKVCREKDKGEMEKKYENKYKELQIYYEKLLEEKVLESEKIAYDAAQKIRAEEEQIRRYITYLQQNSIPLQQHNKLSKFCESLQQHLENKIIENEKYASMLAVDNKQLAVVTQEAQKNEEELMGRVRELEKAAVEARNTIKSYEQQVGSLKSIERKLRAVVADYQSHLQIKQEETITLRNELQKLRVENAEHMGEMGRKENELAIKAGDLEQMERKLARTGKQLAQAMSQLQNNREMLGRLSKAVAEKQNACQLLAQENNFKMEGLNAQLLKSNLSLESSNQRLKQSVQRCQVLEANTARQNKIISELQASLRKLELENNYLKQSEQTLKGQHAVYVGDYKRRITEKGEELARIEATLAEQKRQHTVAVAILEGKVKKLTLGLKKINRIYSTELDLQQRSLRDVRTYIDSFDKLIKNEGRIIQSNTALKIREQMFIIDSQKMEQIRKAKESLEYQKSQREDMQRNKSEKIETGFKQKLEAEVKNFQSVLTLRDRQIQKLQKQKKKLSSQNDEFKEASKVLEKKLKDMDLMFQNERIQHKTRITQLIANFDIQKDKIVAEYGARRDRQEAQMDQIIKEVKIVRKQLQNSKIIIDEQQRKYSTELKSLESQVKSLQTQNQRRRRQLNDLSQQNRSLRETNSKAQIQLKSLTDKNSLFSQAASEAQLRSNQLMGELTVHKSRVERLQEENEDLRRELANKEVEREQLEMGKKKLEADIKQFRLNINKANKSQEIRALQQLDLETRELSNKVNQLKKVNYMMGGTQRDKTPMRS